MFFEKSLHGFDTVSVRFFPNSVYPGPVKDNELVKMLHPANHYFKISEGKAKISETKTPGLLKNQLPHVAGKSEQRCGRIQVVRIKMQGSWLFRNRYQLHDNHAVRWNFLRKTFACRTQVFLQPQIANRK